MKTLKPKKGYLFVDRSTKSIIHEVVTSDKDTTVYEEITEAQANKLLEQWEKELTESVMDEIATGLDRDQYIYIDLQPYMDKKLIFDKTITRNYIRVDKVSKLGLIHLDFNVGTNPPKSLTICKLPNIQSIDRLEFLVDPAKSQSRAYVASGGDEVILNEPTKGRDYVINFNGFFKIF